MNTTTTSTCDRCHQQYLFATAGADGLCAVCARNEFHQRAARPLEAVLDRGFSYVRVKTSTPRPLSEVVARDLYPEYATLFAAAPALLNAARELAAVLCNGDGENTYPAGSQCHNAIENARAAIAAATKETA